MDPLQGGLWNGLGAGFCRFLPFEERQHICTCFRAIKHPLKESAGFGSGGHRRRSPKHKPHPCRMQFICRLGKLSQQALTRLRRQPVRNTHQVCFFAFGGCNHFVNGYGGPQKHSPPAGLFSQAQKITDSCHMDAFAQGCRNDGFHSSLSFLANRAQKTYAPVEARRSSLGSISTLRSGIGSPRISAASICTSCRAIS